jgi:hypothetical protein
MVWLPHQTATAGPGPAGLTPRPRRSRQGRARALPLTAAEPPTPDATGADARRGADPAGGGRRGLTGFGGQGGR